MKLIIVASCLLVVAMSHPNEVRVSEDTLGNYKFHFDTETYKRNEERTADGFTKGRFYYVDNEGVTHELTFKSGAETGFLATSADIPVPVPEEPENPEVVKARSEHLAAWNEELARNGLFETKNVQGLKKRVLVPVIEYVEA